MYQFSFTPYEFNMSHQEGTTKNADLHKTAKMDLSVFAPELFNYLLLLIDYTIYITVRYAVCMLLQIQ